MHKGSMSDLTRSWNHLADSVAATPELSHLQAAVEKLRQAIEEARSAEQRQLALRAAAQQATKDLKAAKLRAHEAAVGLRSNLWGHYGRNSKALHAFGMRPYPTSGFEP
jgi:enolase